MARQRRRKSGPREPNGQLQRPKAVKSLKSSVYILKVEGHDLIKIGKANDIQKRIETYKTHLPFEFFLVDYADFDSEKNAYSVERFLKTDLKDASSFVRSFCPDIRHKTGEWFSANIEEVATLIECTSFLLSWVQYEQLVSRQFAKAMRENKW